MTISRLAPSSIAGFSGVFSRTPPSTYQPSKPFGRSTSTAGKSAGIALDASRCWCPISVRAYLIPRPRSSAMSSLLSWNTTVFARPGAVPVTATACSFPASTFAWACRRSGSGRIPRTVSGIGLGFSTFNSRPKPTACPAARPPVLSPLSSQWRESRRFSVRPSQISCSSAQTASVSSRSIRAASPSALSDPMLEPTMTSTRSPRAASSGRSTESTPIS